MKNRSLPNMFIPNEDHIKYFEEQGGYEALDKIENVFGKSATNYILHHTQILYDRVSLSKTAGGTCEQHSDCSIVRLRYTTIGSRAKVKWWTHVLLHELIHSLVADISLAFELSNDEPLAEGLPILIENLMTKAPKPNKQDMIFTLQTLECLERLAKKHKIPTKTILTYMIGGTGSIISRKAWSKEISREYKEVRIENNFNSKLSSSIKSIYTRDMNSWIKSSK